MLATASLGAVWSSCSPDFGVQGVLDRFGQIEPKIFFAADGYLYSGKWHDSLDAVTEITEHLPTMRKIIVAPYFIDAVNKTGLVPKRSHSLATLKTILSTGSPLAPESFDYVYENIKDDVCLSSISGGTDIISCFALGNPVLPEWRGELQSRGLGMKVEVFNDEGVSSTGVKGELVCTAPFPCMPVGFWNDPDGSRYHSGSGYPQDQERQDR